MLPRCISMFTIMSVRSSIHPSIRPLSIVLLQKKRTSVKHTYIQISVQWAKAASWGSKGLLEYDKEIQESELHTKYRWKMLLLNHCKRIHVPRLSIRFKVTYVYTAIYLSRHVCYFHITSTHVEFLSRLRGL